MIASTEDMRRLFDERRQHIAECKQNRKKTEKFEKVWGHYENFEEIKEAWEKDQIRKKVEKRRDDKARQRGPNWKKKPKEFTTTIGPQKYQYRKTDDKLEDSERLEFIERWCAGYEMKVDVSWPADKKLRYQRFATRQKTAREKIQFEEGQVGTQEQLRPRYTAYFSNLLDEKLELRKYPTDWIDDFMYHLYRGKELKVHKPVDNYRKLWEETVHPTDSSVTKYAAYRRFKENIAYRSKTSQNIQAFIQGNKDPLVQQREKEAEQRLKSKRTREEDDQKCRSFKLKDCERNKKANKEKYWMNRPQFTDLERTFNQYIDEAPDVNDKDVKDPLNEKAFEHRLNWITEAKQTGIIHVKNDKIPFPLSWTKEIRQEYHNWKQRHQRKYNIGKDHKLSFQYAWSKVTRSAQLRNLPLSITESDVAYMVKCPCHYCGREPGSPFRIGIDCVIHHLGYIPGNVVPCCYQCNFAKSNLDKDVFLECCTFLHNRKNGSQESSNLELFKAAKSTNQLYNYKRRAKCSGLDFHLSDEQAIRLLKGNCHYCGRPEANGIDRVDNNGIYDWFNVVSCCSTCNYLKFKFSLQDFIDMCAGIASKNMHQ